jgi:hypothetical protein
MLIIDVRKTKEDVEVKNVCCTFDGVARAHERGSIDRPRKKPKTKNTDLCFFETLVVVPHAKLTPSIYPFPIKPHTTLTKMLKFNYEGRHYGL